MFIGAFNHCILLFWSENKDIALLNLVSYFLYNLYYTAGRKRPLYNPKLYGFKCGLIKYYKSALKDVYDVNDPRTWKSICLSCNMSRNLSCKITCCYYMDSGILLGTKTLVELIRHYIRDTVRVFSVCHA